MSFLDRFTSKKRGAGTKAVVKKDVTVKEKHVQKERTVAEETHATEAKGSKRKVAVGTERAHRVLLRPIISEKSAHLADQNQYVFRVANSTNKVEVIKAIEEIYHLKPSGVRIITVRGKRVQRGRIVGWTQAHKKAIVRMPKGTTLPLYEGV